MAEKDLYITDVDIIFEEHRGERMPEHVGSHVRGSTDQGGKGVHSVSGRLLGKSGTEPVDEQGPSSFAAGTDFGKKRMKSLNVR